MQQKRVEPTKVDETRDQATARQKANTISHHTKDLNVYNGQLRHWGSAEGKELKVPEVLHGIAYAFYPYKPGVHKKDPRSYYKRIGRQGSTWPDALVDCKLITMMRYQFSLRDNDLLYVSVLMYIDKRKANVGWEWYQLPYWHVGGIDLKKYSVEEIEDAWRVHGLMTKQAREVKAEPRIYAVFRAMKGGSEQS